MMTPGNRACDLQERVRTFVWRGGEKEKVTLWASVGTASLREDPRGSELVGRSGEMVR